MSKEISSKVVSWKSELAKISAVIVMLEQQQQDYLAAYALHETYK